jgi:hypothetical protein
VGAVFFQNAERQDAGLVGPVQGLVPIAYGQFLPAESNLLGLNGDDPSEKKQ